MELETFYTGMDVNELASKLDYTAKNNETVFSVLYTSDDEEGLKNVSEGFPVKKKGTDYFDLDEKDYEDIEKLQSEILNGSVLVLFKNEIYNDNLHYPSDISSEPIYISTINILGYFKNANGLFFVKNPECEVTLETPVQLQLK